MADNAYGLANDPDRIADTMSSEDSIVNITC